MSADPKSLALTAITTTTLKTPPTSTEPKTKLELNQEVDNDKNGQRNFLSHSRRLQGAPLKTFRSTDEFVAGWVAAFINTSALFPINKLIFRQMAGGHKTLFAADQMKEEG